MGILQDPNMGNKYQQKVSDMLSHQTSLNWKADATEQRIDLRQSGQVESVDEGAVCRLESWSTVQKIPLPLSPGRSPQFHFWHVTSKVSWEGSVFLIHLQRPREKVKFWCWVGHDICSFLIPVVPGGRKHGSLGRGGSEWQSSRLSGYKHYTHYTKQKQTPQTTTTNHVPQSHQANQSINRLQSPHR